MCVCVCVCVCVGWGGCTYNVALGGLPQQAPEGDDGGHAGAVEEEDGGQALQVERVPDVAPVER